MNFKKSRENTNYYNRNGRGAITTDSIHQKISMGMLQTILYQ